MTAVPDFAKGGGLVPVVVQDAATADVLMLAYMDREAYDATLATGEMHYRSRSRGRLWRKGEESGHVQKLVALLLDCDGDTLLARVRQTGPACHEGTPTCFERALAGEGEAGLAELERVVAERLAEPVEGSHTTRLLSDPNLRLKKVAEEAGELIMAAKDRDRARLADEAADVLYHTLVAAQAEGVTPRDVLRRLADRRGAPRRPVGGTEAL
ncbi:MAG TPA: bifunctional phosphoribosyl-AMP cyclohydrolase/phosphoribosyl-ATP diphosphatase HisIE [Candidatus Thermoplasmatota archaeon]|nr:bifunctional phosphoribosyl-AMP cyclohydrolase/phosphoribosyl-ATP diphosphatase HisIE [Candidatus Thermoplasmatota archaeon]